MKLVYVWVSNYRNFIIEQGFQITNDLIIDVVDYSKKENKLNINIKENYEETLYKNNIVDVSAIVGENGSGKTTICNMLMDYIPSNGVIIDDKTSIFDENKYIEEVNKKKSVYIFIDDKQNNKILIYGRNINIEINEEIKLKCKKIINEYNDINIKNLHMIYLSNVFNMAELRNNYYEKNLRKDNLQILQMYTPCFILKNRLDEYRRSFGYKTKDNEYLKTIQNYANDMSISETALYIKKQEELFLDCYGVITEDVKNNLPIFKSYIFEVSEFQAFKGNIIDYWDVNKRDFNDKFHKLDKMDQAKIAAERIYYLLKERNKESTNTSMWLQIFILILSEVYLALTGSGDKDNLMQNIEAFANKNEVLEDIDYDIVKEIEEKLPKSQLYKTFWFNQIIQCIQEMKKMRNNKKWSLGKRYFSEEKYADNEKGLIDWYKNELDNENSFFIRYLNFKQNATSSGELAFANLYTYINQALKKVPEGHFIILFIDEIDVYMHPRWQQMILEKLIRYLEKLKKWNFQIILTTHSPIIISDIPNGNIIFINKNDDNSIYLKKSQVKTFGANIYDLYRNGFFLKENNYGVIGDFATEKIYEVEDILSEIIKQIQLITEEAEKKAVTLWDNKDNLNKEKFISEKAKIIRNTKIASIKRDYTSKLDECKKIIDIIGEEFIRKTLLKEYKYICEVFDIERKEDNEELIEIKNKFERLSKNDQNELIKFIIDRRKN